MKRIYKVSIFFILLFLTHNMFSQETLFSVKEFYLDEHDMTAGVPPVMRKDQNGKICARIKIETSYELAIEAGIAGIVDRERKGAEIWLYLPYQTRKLNSIGHINLGTIRDYVLPLRMEPGRTYIMKLNTPRGSKVYDASKKQKVSIKVIPGNAKLEINGFSHKLDSRGIIQLEMPYGIHDVALSAENYYSTIKHLNIGEEYDGREFIIQLKQAFGWLKADLKSDETLLVDDKQYTSAQLTNNMLAIKSGNYKVRIDKLLHQPYSTTVQIKDSCISVLAPEFVPNYKEMELVVDKSAEIWIDGVRRSAGVWNGKLEYGDHKVECRLKGHRTSEQVYRIAPDTDPKIELESPTPILGQLTVFSEPSGADVYLNDVKVGTTPYSQQVIIGDYSISIKKNGYDPEYKRISIKEGETIKESVKLNNIFPVHIGVRPMYLANIKVDDIYRVHKEHYEVFMLEVGEHDVEISASGFQAIKKKIVVKEPNQTFDYRLKRKLYHKSQFYFGGDASLMNDYFMYGGHMGFYLKNFNMEVSYMMGSEASEKIYWNAQQVIVRPIVYEYKPAYIGLRVGWGMLLGRGFRITPQIGVNYLMLNGTELDTNYTKYDASYCATLPVTAGLKFSLALGGCMELSFAPEYAMTLLPADMYDALCNASSTINGWGNGLVLKAGFGFYF